jgi:hypothetical protein
MNNRSGFLALFTLLVLLAAVLPGQWTNARITGYVTDEDGAYLPGVTITATNIGNNAETATTTGKKKGTFRFPSLAPGMYQVSADLEGYQSFVVSGIRLTADQSSTLHIKLKKKQAQEEAAQPAV